MLQNVSICRLPAAGLLEALPERRMVFTKARLQAAETVAALSGGSVVHGPSREGLCARDVLVLEEPCDVPGQPVARFFLTETE